MYEYFTLLKDINRAKENNEDIFPNKEVEDYFYNKTVLEVTKYLFATKTFSLNVVL